MINHFAYVSLIHPCSTACCLIVRLSLLFQTFSVIVLPGSQEKHFSECSWPVKNPLPLTLACQSPVICYSTALMQIVWGMAGSRVFFFSSVCIQEICLCSTKSKNILMNTELQGLDEMLDACSSAAVLVSFYVPTIILYFGFSSN